MKSEFRDKDLIDIGQGVGISFYGFNGDEDGGRRVGLLYEHDRPDGAGRCGGGIAWEKRSPTDTSALWTLESGGDWEHITVSPSLACRTCGHHGFIKNGRWVPC